jgi:hypothetical protein
MLATLERGITGGKWYSLYDKVWKIENLQRAAQKVAAGKSPKKPDGRRCRRYAEQSAKRLPPLQQMLKEGSYQPEPAQRVWIPKLGSKELRPLGVPPVENRVVEMALRHVLEPCLSGSNPNTTRPTTGWGMRFGVIKALHGRSDIAASSSCQNCSRVAGTYKSADSLCERSKEFTAMTFSGGINLAAVNAVGKALGDGLGVDR